MVYKSNVACCVPQCSERCDKKRKISLHCVPKEAAKRRQWQNAIRSGKPLSDYMRVCSLHFKLTDFIPTGEYFFLGIFPPFNEVHDY